MACAKCGSRVLVEGVKVVDHGDLNMMLDLKVRVDRDPGALLFKGSEWSTLEAKVCGDCGFLELFAANPAGLLRASKSRKKR